MLTKVLFDFLNIFPLPREGNIAQKKFIQRKSCIICISFMYGGCSAALRGCMAPFSDDILNVSYRRPLLWQLTFWWWQVETSLVSFRKKHHALHGGAFSLLQGPGVATSKFYWGLSSFPKGRHNPVQQRDFSLPQGSPQASPIGGFFPASGVATSKSNRGLSPCLRGRHKPVL